MTTSPDPSTNLAVELAQLRGESNTGLADIKGTLGVLVERTYRTDADVRQLREDTEKEIRELKAKVESLEGRRFPLPVVGALTGVGALLATVIGLLVTR
ncbi:hypothetical protein [Streptomyces sp. NPDC002845]